MSTDTNVRSDSSTEVGRLQQAVLGGSVPRPLVVVNGERSGLAAMETALKLAGNETIAIDVLYVVDTPEHNDFALRRAESEGEEAIAEAIEMADRVGVETNRWFRYGRTDREVRSFVETHPVDLVILGAPRRRGIKRVVTPGSVIPRVRRGTDVPVLAVTPDRST
ncbi:MAG: universal stress protein [Salinarchaeum sp.]